APEAASQREAWEASASIVAMDADVATTKRMSMSRRALVKGSAVQASPMVSIPASVAEPAASKSERTGSLHVNVIQSAGRTNAPPYGTPRRRYVIDLGPSASSETSAQHGSSNALG